MMCEQELSAFFAHIDEISQDSSSLDQFQLLQKYRNENVRLVQTLSKIRETTKGLLDILKEERRIKAQSQQQLDHVNGQFSELQKKFDKLERSNVNNEFSYRETIDEYKQKQQSLIAEKQELAKDYFEVLEEATMFHNYEIKKERLKLITKTSTFLKGILGDKFKKPMLITKKSVSKRSRTTKKESTTDVEAIKKTKRRKLDIFEMQSISEASSPASFYDEGTADMAEENENDSAYTYNTFSIGNETSYTFLQSKKVSTFSQTVSQCKCYIDTEETELVSVGVNTENVILSPSLPSLRDDDDLIFDQDQVVNSTVNSISETDSYDNVENVAESNYSLSCCSDDNEMLPILSTPPRINIHKSSLEKLTDTSNFDTLSNLSSISPLKDEISKSSEKIKNASKNLLNNFKLPRLSLTPTKEMKDQETETCEPTRALMSDKSTYTTRSLTHRGTMTPALITKNFGMQFPDVSFDKILEMMEFEVPDCLSPIKDIEKVTQETQTDIKNVTRELCSTSEINKNLLTSEEQSFIVLGQTIFNLFLNRLKENNKTVKDDDIRTREKLWQFLRQQYLDRFDELTFDEYFNTSLISENEYNENLHKSKSQESIDDLKEVKCNLDANLILKDIETELYVSESSGSLKSSDSSEKCNSEHQETFSHEDLDNLPSSTEKENECETSLSLSPIAEINHNDPVDVHIQEIEKILKDIEFLVKEPVKLVSPILEFEDFMWSTIFPSNDNKINEEESPIEDEHVLHGYRIEHEPINIPIEFCYSPDEPPYISTSSITPYQPRIIPLENTIRRNLDTTHKDVIAYNQKTRSKLVLWQQEHKITSKNNDKLLCKMRKIIKCYLDSEWTIENLEICVNGLQNRNETILIEAIYETVEDNLWDKEINSDFTPPAPPLPRFQQKLILLISKLTEINSRLPHLLIADLELKLFKFEESSSASLDHLRNLAYYYTALVDLFFEGNSTMAFYFIVKCMYFFGHKAIVMAFVIIKAFPLTLPKKSLLLKKYNDSVELENLTGLELSKFRIELEWVDSLDLCVMYLLTNIQMYRKKDEEFKIIYEHELFNYVPKFYGFALNFISAQKLITILMNRIENGELTNLSMALILLGKRMNSDSTIKILLKEHLMPLLYKYINEDINNSDNIEQAKIDKICLLIEAISSILKPLGEEKGGKIFEEVFPLIINIHSRSSRQQIQECCIKAILRLQRFIKNHKEIYEIIKHRYENGEPFSETLSHAISTFIHRKKQVYFKN
ncbi:hypothetical protein PVAND_012137 [Polypedilum vanderplanki]|uniref:Uncharacterized protein n=1 Tax=Polypedilum vanderplanki TaxID=319348 RepID=A0A9J6CMF8_POLVA|nr:hypothetical protein PVAND_012137 [Polypedilum vanderplanki]